MTDTTADNGVTRAEVQAADNWWDDLGEGRRVQVHRWVAQRGALTHDPDEGQLTIEDAIGGPE